MQNVLAVIPRSTVGFIMSALYTVAAVALVAIDRKAKGGGWITLHGMGSYLITLPISFLGERLGIRPDFRRFPDMALAIGGCAVIAYFVGWSLERAFRFLLSSAQAG